MRKVILFQGDSITDCNRGRMPEEYAILGFGYPTMVAGELGLTHPYEYTYYNRGISGNRIVDVYARIKEDIVNLKPDYMSLLIGVNDAWHAYSRNAGVSAEKFEKVYCLMIEELQEEFPELKIMILEPFVIPGSVTGHPDADAERWEYFSKEVALRAQAAKRVAEKYGLVFVPLQDAFDAVDTQEDRKYWTWDGVHPTPGGHTIIKNAWLKAFESMR